MNHLHILDISSGVLTRKILEIKLSKALKMEKRILFLNKTKNEWIIPLMQSFIIKWKVIKLKIIKYIGKIRIVRYHKEEKIIRADKNLLSQVMIIAEKKETF